MSYDLGELAREHLTCPYCGAKPKAACRTVRVTTRLPHTATRSHEARKRPLYEARTIGRQAGEWSMAGQMAYALEKAGYTELGRWARKLEEELYPEWLR